MKQLLGYTHWLDEVEAEIKQMRDFRSFLAEHRGKAKFYIHNE